MGELFGQEDGELDAVQEFRITNFAALKIDKVDQVFHPAVNSPNPDVFDRDIVHREGVGQGIEKSGRVLGDHPQARER